MIYRHFKNPSICKALIDRTKMIRNRQKDDEEVTDIRYDWDKTDSLTLVLAQTRLSSTPAPVGHFDTCDGSERPTLGPTQHHNLGLKTLLTRILIENWDTSQAD